MAVTEDDLAFLRRAVDLARTALEVGDEPFGSVLVSAAGEELFAAHNHVVSGDGTQHPEFEIARWAGENLNPEERKSATVYTSNEHCPMCSAAHAWVGLGRIVYAVSTEQLLAWRHELAQVRGPVEPLTIGQVAPGLTVDGPAPEFAIEMRSLHHEFARGN